MVIDIVNHLALTFCHRFQAGDLVWLEATNLSTDELLPKLASKRHGPFPVKDKLLELTYQLELPTHWKIHNIFHVNVLSEAKPDTIPNCQNPPPPPVKINDKDYYVIEKYIDMQWFQNRFQFKISWEGFGEEHDTWETADDIDSSEGPQLLQEGDEDFNLEEDFYQRHSNTPCHTDPPSKRKRPTQCL